jgi:oxygen-dependent protoporphyrinogen oxidase
MHVLVIGGGISGLAAAHALQEGGATVTLLEASPRLGGKLLSGDIAGTTAVDLGAESMLARRPEAVDLARAAGLGDDLCTPSAGAAIWSRGELVPMPKGHVMGVPADPASLSGLLSAEGVARAAEDATLPRTPVGEDVALGGYIAARLGEEVVDRLVEPLLGGVYAGNAYRISMRAAVPQLYEAARSERSLLAGVRALQERAAGTTPAPAGPVFAGIAGGIGRLPEAVARTCRAAGVRIRTSTPVRLIRRRPGGPLAGGPPGGPPWQAVLAGGDTVTADAVIVAAPAHEAARLLAGEVPAAAEELESVEYASMALITMAFRRADLHGAPLEGSGFLVPPVDGRHIKAATFSARKWDWVAAQDPSLFVLRTSIGRHHDDADLTRSDADLVRLSRDDLRDATGLGAKPVDTVVTRWNDGLPQYPVGHLERSARIRHDLAALPGLAVCGAAYDGVGIPACIAGARRAAARTLAQATPHGE